MISDNKIANAVSGKTARACDCCLKKRARWYCPADDAFLCQSCDGSVHSANPLARRHDRVRLKTASLKAPPINHLPTWQRGTTPKTRTPRHGKPSGTNLNSNPVHTVPEVEETTSSSQDYENEEQLLYRVPISDVNFVSEINYYPTTTSYGATYDDLHEFAADVETLLGKELDEEQLGLFDEVKDDNTPAIDFSNTIKLEDDDVIDVENDDVEIKEPFEFTFDYYDDDDFVNTCEVEKVEVHEIPVGCEAGDHDKREMMMMMRLRLDYEAISEAWGDQGSPWMNGQRPQINHQDCWFHCMGGTITGSELSAPLTYVDHHHQLGSTGVTMNTSDGGREARVSRYREKRRTRLFSKKIRYEVRKLNAEKRPRMKGRFVKRSSFASTVTAFPLRSK